MSGIFVEEGESKMSAREAREEWRRLEERRSLSGIFVEEGESKTSAREAREKWRSLEERRSHEEMGGQTSLEIGIGRTRSRMGSYDQRSVWERQMLAQEIVPICPSFCFLVYSNLGIRGYVEMDYWVLG